MNTAIEAVDLSKNRSDLRGYIKSSIETSDDLKDRFTENVKLIQVNIEKKKKDAKQQTISEETLFTWIKMEMNQLKRLILDGMDIDALAMLYADAYRGYGILQPYVTDNRFSDVKMISYDRIFTKGKNGWERQPVKFNSQDEADKFVQALFNKNSSVLNVKFPYNNCIDQQYRFRLNGSFGDINPLGAFTVIRKQSHYQLTDEQLIESGTTNEHIQALNEVIAWCMVSYFVYGEQNSGKTTYLGNCLDKIPDPRYALTTFEDTPEFWLKKSNWHPHITRPHVGDGFDPIALDTLIHNFFRESGEWGTVGEVRGPEAFTMLGGASGGNPFACSVHAPTMNLAWKRLLFLSINSSGMREETLETFFKLYFKVGIGMATEGAIKVVETVSMEDDQGDHIDIWKRIPEKGWNFNPLPNWFRNKAINNSLIPRALLKKARVI